MLSRRSTPPDTECVQMQKNITVSSSQFSNPTCPTAGHAPLSMRVDYSSQVRNTPSIEAYTPYRGTL